MEKDEVLQVISRLFAATDNIDWPVVADCFDEQFVLDYSSMGGGKPKTITPEMVIAAWSSFLPGFDKTDHRLYDFNIEIDGDKAFAAYKCQAEHFIASERWKVEGSYNTDLVHKNGRWYITRQKMNFIKQEGNRKLPDIAAARLRR